jgi:hypothetical protein
MSVFKYTAGLQNVGSYQVSGKPFASGSLDATNSMSVEFPYVTQWITIVNHDSNHLRVGFSENGVEGTNYFRCGPQAGNENSQNLTISVKTTELWFTGSTDFDIVAGLTNIPVERINNLSGSDDIIGNNWSGSVGVG